MAYIQHATWAKNELLNDVVLQMVMSHHPESIVDFGTGTGELLSLFPNVIQRIGIDISHEMLSIIQDPNIVKILADVHSTELQTASVDLVVCRQVLHYCQPSVVLKEANRILRRDGHVLVIQGTDCDAVPADWYARWNTFKQVKERKHLSRTVIMRAAAEANFEVAVERHCQVTVRLNWEDLFNKYAAISQRQQKAIVTFFQQTPKTIAELMRLEIQSDGISYLRVFSCFLLCKTA